MKIIAAVGVVTLLILMISQVNKSYGWSDQSCVVYESEHLLKLKLMTSDSDRNHPCDKVVDEAIIDGWKMVGSTVKPCDSCQGYPNLGYFIR